MTADDLTFSLVALSAVFFVVDPLLVVPIPSPSPRATRSTSAARPRRARR